MPALSRTWFHAPGENEVSTVDFIILCVCAVIAAPMLIELGTLHIMGWLGEFMVGIGIVCFYGAFIAVLIRGCNALT